MCLSQASDLSLTPPSFPFDNHRFFFKIWDSHFYSHLLAEDLGFSHWGVHDSSCSLPLGAARLWSPVYYLMWMWCVSVCVCVCVCVWSVCVWCGYPCFYMKLRGTGARDLSLGPGQLECQSVQLSPSVMSDSLRPHEVQHARPPCPSPTPGVHSNSCSSSRWCHPAISSSVIPFSSCPQSLPASGFFQWVNSSHEVAKVLEFQL